ncbi:phosphoenolpyruvate synthase [Desulfofustis glycolicus]|uniref:Phosphoenolpyruvate synthase n=1 Tax=Desulfofustis glycolicus DSM 9705 TaxID=1121409 RepID=A0A1M5X2C1_9BACT|nr:phosphoenolpyruvate synthase [Desulfofustis glycolicus]SHH93900.1 phosphoenolpyruvate synthase [Desulfofustis glycolicus DSM 9705]
MSETDYIKWFSDISSADLDTVGGKNSSLGEMIRELGESGVRVPDGFATTAAAYREFLDYNEIKDQLGKILKSYHAGDLELKTAGEQARELILDGEFPESIGTAIKEAYRQLGSGRDTQQGADGDKLDVAVRSSATAEDLPEASFAGQQETFLNISGSRELLNSCRRCYASLFTDRAIAYRHNKGFDDMDLAISVGVQRMVRSDKAGSGVMFTLDTESGFPKVVMVDAVWGLGENIVQGTVTPDEYRVFKPFLDQEGVVPIIEKRLGTKEKTLIYGRGGTGSTRNIDTPPRRRKQFVLSDQEVLQLARWACIVEKHYGKPMDLEWAKDGNTDELFIVQARPETVQSQKQEGPLQRYRLKETAEPLVTGLAVGDAIAAGKVQLLEHKDEMSSFEEGSILVTEMTDPDWGPVLKRAAGIVTEHGGRTSHAAIVSRELGLPAVVGAEGAMDKLRGCDEATVDCAEGSKGFVFEGRLDYERQEIDIQDIDQVDVPIMLNIATPEAASRWWRLPADGIGLARMEFIINNLIGVHPMALVEPDRIEDEAVRQQIEEAADGYEELPEFFIDTLSRGIGKIAASRYPDPVIVRMSDLKTNEYRELIGGEWFEPEEENPMLGFRGASRYYSDRYRAAFALECAAIRRVREQLGFVNVVVMIPFCRTLEEADKVLEVMAENGLRRGENGLEVYVMCEIPSNVILAEDFADRFDGFSIGSNDLTQLILGIDRDLAELAELFDERNEAVKRMICEVIERAHRKGRKVGICGQAPSDYPDFARFLVDAGIDSISLNPDSVIGVRRHLAGRDPD